MTMNKKSPIVGPIQCAGIICFRGDDVLLIQRGTPPRAGEWSIPGGRIEPGETQEAAALRELFEETGVTAKPCGKTAMIPAHFDGIDYHLHDFAALWISGAPRAGDDAVHAEFMPPSALDALGMWPKTRAVIEQARTQIQSTCKK